MKHLFKKRWTVICVSMKHGLMQSRTGDYYFKFAAERYANNGNNDLARMYAGVPAAPPIQFFVMKSSEADKHAHEIVWDDRGTPSFNEDALQYHFGKINGTGTHEAASAV